MNNQNKYIPYGKHKVTDDDINAVINVLKDGNLTQGGITPEFERLVAKKSGSKYAIALNSATSALHLACLSLNLKKGDYLWTTPNTFVASANCGLYCNASIDFVDIDPHTGLMSEKALEKKLEIACINNCLPKVVIPVHFAGASCNMYEIAKLSNKFGFSIIEDSSHAIGGKYRSKFIGGCQYSSLSVFSFHPVKIITTGEGGVVTTNDIKLAQKIYDLRSHGIVKDNARFKLQNEGSWHYEQQELGFNYRMTDIQAALGISQLERLDQIVSERNDKLNYYKKILKSMPLKLLDIPNDVYSSVHLAVIRLSNQCPEHHKNVFEGLRQKGIGVQLHYKPVHLHPFYRQKGFTEGDFPESEKYAHNAITLPLFSDLTKGDQIRVKNVLKDLMS